jgi:tRNA A37 methylthiotransferase MiaB
MLEYLCDGTLDTAARSGKRGERSAAMLPVSACCARVCTFCACVHLVSTSVVIA